MIARLKFQAKNFLDDSRRKWQFATYAWLLRNTGGHAKFIDTELVLPTEDHFPDRGLKGRAGVATLFQRVRDHAGMADWPCTVAVEGAEPHAGGELPDTRGLRVITYRRGEFDSGALVAHFSRELARYLLTTVQEPPPGGESRHEAAVELAAGFLGFGLFMVNAAAQHAIFRLSEGELAHALALFCLLRRLPPDSTDEHLNPHLRKYVRLAALDLAQHEAAFQQLRAVVAVETAECTLPTRAV
jgi:hypothetical protein